MKLRFIGTMAISCCPVAAMVHGGEHFAAVSIDAVGHYPILEKPDEFNRALRDAAKQFATKR